MHSQFSDLPIFVSVVECGSFSSAAKQLHLTKSAVSKRINHLEDKLGSRLLNRTTRKLSLTEAGERYYEYAAQALNLARQGVDAVTELQGEPRGRLKITAPMTFGVLHVAPLISEFLSRYPKVEVDLQLEDQMVDLVAGRFDLGIRIGHLPDSNLIAKRLAPCRTVLCASPDYVSRMGSPSKPDDLAQHNCLRYSYFRGGNEWLFSIKVTNIKFCLRAILSSTIVKPSEEHCLPALALRKCRHLSSAKSYMTESSSPSCQSISCHNIFSTLFFQNANTCH